MRLTTVILIASLMQVSAAGFAQKITLNQRNTSLESILDEIRKQSGYDYYFDSKIVAKDQRTSISVKDASVEAALKAALDGLALIYEIDGKTIAIKRKEKSFLENMMARFREIDVSGRVVDTDGRGLPGASVSVKGKGGKAVSTGANGNFYLKGVDEDAVLVISFIGYVPKEVKAANELGDVVLEVSTSKLDEVQVIAYGVTSQRLSTGNVTSVKAKDIEKQPVSNPILALQGRVPGLTVTQANGIAGGGVTIRVQGQNSIGNGNDPLYIIDGVPYVSQMMGTTTAAFVLGTSGGPSGSGSGNPLNYININDIESIDVLKDADATAIYGSRAANGAILITTKKGKTGPAKVTLNAQQGLGVIARKLKVLNLSQYLEMRREALKNDGITTLPAGAYDLDGTWDLNKDTDWQKELVGRTTGYQNYTANISGGSESFKYLIGSSYNRQTAMFPGDFADNRVGVNVNLSGTSLNKRFRFEFTTSYLNDNNQLPSVDLFNNALILPPNAPDLYNEDGSLNWGLNSLGKPTWDNPLASTLNRYENQTNNLIANSSLSYQFTSNFEFTSNFGYNRLEAGEFTGYPLEAKRPDRRTQRTAVFSNSITSSWIIEPQFHFKKNIAGGNFDALVGSTFQKRNNNGMGITALGQTDDSVLKNLYAATTFYPTPSIVSTYNYNAIFGRIGYNWQDKYLLNISGRRDGSSRFGSANLFHNFAALGAAWIFSQEGFVKNNLPFLSFGKLKASYGTTGNDQIPDYQFLNLYSPNQFNLPYQGGNAIDINGLYNPYLQWEETKKLSLGMDLGFLSDRFLLTVTYGRNRSSNQLLDYTLPTTTGFSSILTNFPATVENQTWEFNLNSINIKSGKFHWTTNLNLTLPHNKLISFPNFEQSTYNDMLVIGQPISVTKAFHLHGVNSTTGVYEFVDRNGSVVPASSLDFSLDKTSLVNTDPKFYGGLSNTISFKGFSVDFLFQFVKQVSISPNLGRALAPGWPLTNQPLSVLDRWQKAGDQKNVQKYTNSDFNVSQPFGYITSSDAGFTDASFIRLKNLAISYEFSDKILSRLKISNLKIFCNSQNLLTLTNFKGSDPETGNSPVLRITTLGLNIGL